MRLPGLLQDDDDGPAVAALRTYYGTGGHPELGPFTGAYFDAWDSTGSRSADRDRFTADDLVAVSLLSVEVPAKAALLLLGDQAAEFAKLLRDVGDDRDLVEEKSEWPNAWAGWTLWARLIDLPDVGPTTASKLFARKRPRLRPIYDSVVANVIDSDRIWEPLRLQLATDPSLHERLLRLRQDAQLPPAVTALRVFDVVAWMEGKYGATHFGRPPN